MSSNLKVLFPCNPLDPKVVDPEFASELAAVRTLGGAYELFDFDELKRLVRDGKDAAASFNVAKRNGARMSYGKNWIYRGWMMTPEEYQALLSAGRVFDMEFLNSAAQYSLCHYFPLIHPYIDEHSTFIHAQEGEEVDYAALVAAFEDEGEELFGKGNRKLFVKDWVKSAKGNDAATIINDYRDESEVRKVCAELRKERGDNFNMGFVFKPFIKMEKRSDGQNEEFRAFFVNDELVSWMPTHGPGGRDFKCPQWLLDLAKNIPSDFYTVDVGFMKGFTVMPEEGSFILEVGDGGVSGLSIGQLPIAFYSMIKSILDGKPVEEEKEEENEQA